jgi:hypothetical protein
VGDHSGNKLLNGTYGLLDQKIDFHGKLGTDVKISNATTGFARSPSIPYPTAGKRPGLVLVKLVRPTPNRSPDRI